jgi:predicted nucleic acid-binding protein
VLFDTDVLVWVLRGSDRAATVVNNSAERCASVVTYMELLQGAQDKQDVRTIKQFLADLRLHILPLSENIGHRASVYMEEYGLTTSIGMADALIAATAVENHEQLLTGNQRHFKPIKELDLKTFTA